MKQTKNKHWFTLVELIVVVTILSILSTFAYVSFQWYTRDARNTQRTAELWNLAKKIDISLVQWIQLLSMVDGTWSTIQNESWTQLRIWWREWYSSLSGMYKAWDINFTVLWLDDNTFVDPLVGTSYKIWVTTHGNRYQVAATIENDIWWDSLVNGNYFPRTSLRNRVPLDSTLNNTGSTILHMREWISFIESWLILGDRVEVSGTWLYIINSVQWNTVLISTWLVNKWQNLYLKWDETRSLIKAWKNFGSGHQPIKVGWWDADYTPYQLR